MATAAEAIAFINDLPAEERAAFATAFANDGGEVVKDVRSKTYAKGKADQKKDGATVAADLATATAELEALRAEYDEFKTKTPDAAAIEKRVRDQLQPKLDAEKARADAAAATLRDRDVALAMGGLVAALRTPADDGSAMLADYEPVVQSRYGDRIRVQPDGSVRVLQPDSEIAYEAADTPAAVKLLAADLRKRIPPAFLASNADTGAGVQNGGGGFGGGGDLFSRIRAEAAAESTKRQTTTATLAERMGMRPAVGTA